MQISLSTFGIRRRPPKQGSRGHYLQTSTHLHTPPSPPFLYPFHPSPSTPSLMNSPVPTPSLTLQLWQEHLTPLRRMRKAYSSLSRRGIYLTKTVYKDGNGVIESLKVNAASSTSYTIRFSPYNYNITEEYTDGRLPTTKHAVLTISTPGC